MKSSTRLGAIGKGIWLESKSFDDDGYRPIRTRFKGHTFDASVCNRKIIIARLYHEGYHSARDRNGHGTHCAGSPVKIKGRVVQGVALAARLAIYNILLGPRSKKFSEWYLSLAIDDCIKDGVDIISIASDGFQSSPFKYSDAVAKGIVVVCCTRNSGPFPGQVDNAYPWLITVAAGEMDEPDINLPRERFKVRHARPNSPRSKKNSGASKGSS